MWYFGTESSPYSLRYQCNLVIMIFLCWFVGSIPTVAGIFFKLARCGYTLRVTSQAFYYVLHGYSLGKEIAVERTQFSKCSTCNNVIPKLKVVQVLVE
jgi:hypothetical protein